MALAVVNSTDAQATTFAHNAGSGDRRWLFVLVGTHDATAPLGVVTGITYGGVAMTPLASALESFAAGSQEVRHTTWALENPATGSNNVVITLDNVVNSLCAVAVTYSDCGGPGPNVASTNGNISNISLNITTTESTSLILGGWRGQSARGVTPGSGVTEVDSVSGGTDIFFEWAGTKAATGGADNWTITLATATRSAATAVEVLEDLGGGGEPDYTLDLDAGSYTLTGNAADLLASRLLALDAGSYAITGQAASILAARSLALDAGSYTLTGNAVSLLAARLLSMDAGSYALTGQDAALVVSRLLGLDAGSYTLTGLAADLQYNEAGGPDYTLALDAGSYTLTGNAAGMTVARKLALDAGSYTVTGNDAATLAQRALSLDAGAYTLTGRDAALVVSRLLTLEPGSYTLNGFAVTLDYSGQVLGAVVELSDAAAYAVGLDNAAAYAVLLSDGALCVVALEDGLL